MNQSELNPTSSNYYLIELHLSQIYDFFLFAALIQAQILVFVSTHESSLYLTKRFLVGDYLF